MQGRQQLHAWAPRMWHATAKCGPPYAACMHGAGLCQRLCGFSSLVYSLQVYVTDRAAFPFGWRLARRQALWSPAMGAALHSALADAYRRRGGLHAVMAGAWASFDAWAREPRYADASSLDCRFISSA